MSEPECGARLNDVTDIVCYRPAGHTGQHQGEMVVTWSDDA